jgi:hypothetical protein
MRAYYNVIMPLMSSRCTKCGSELNGVFNLEKKLVYLMLVATFRGNNLQKIAPITRPNTCPNVSIPSAGVPTVVLLPVKLKNKNKERSNPIPKTYSSGLNLGISSMYAAARPNNPAEAPADIVGKGTNSIEIDDRIPHTRKTSKKRLAFTFLS